MIKLIRCDGRFLKLSCLAGGSSSDGGGWPPRRFDGLFSAVRVLSLGILRMLSSGSRLT